jgi:hypothetical protein
LLYKPEFEPELPYLVAFQCGLALRGVQPIRNFDLTLFRRRDSNPTYAS